MSDGGDAHPLRRLQHAVVEACQQDRDVACAQVVDRREVERVQGADGKRKGLQGPGQYCYAGRLQFNPAPPGGEPARYDLVDVYRLFNAADEAAPWRQDPNNPGEILYTKNTQSCGELRGFSGDGREVYGINSPE